MGQYHKRRKGARRERKRQRFKGLVTTARRSRRGLCPTFKASVVAGPLAFLTEDLLMQALSQAKRC